MGLQLTNGGGTANFGKRQKKKNFTSSEARTRAMSSIRQEGEDIDSDSENENK